MANRAGLLFGPMIAMVVAPALGADHRVEGDRWAIATGHEDATAAGVEVLRGGGNVIDAAVAASLALGVAEPYGSGLGGKLVLLYHDARTGEVSCIEALCPAARGINAEEFAGLPREDRRRGWRSVCVPGLPAGLFAVHETWGSKPWEELFGPAIDLAENGVVVSQEMRSLYAPHEKRIAGEPEVARYYSSDGETPRAGDRLKNADLADTLRRFAAAGHDGFYRGETAERMVEAAQEAGAPLSLEDFSSYQPRFLEPLAVNYRGYRVYSSPPPLTGGATVLAVLKVQESRDWPVGQARDAEYIDALGRILQCVYPRVSKAVGDAPKSMADAKAMLNDEAIRSVRQRAEALDPADPYAVPVAMTATLDDLSEASTSHLTVIDAEGNMVSLTQSLSLHFGACVIAPGTGVLLNDSMSNFATVSKGSVNYLTGGKRPRSTVSPTLVTLDGLPVLSLGIPGGQRIPTTTAQLLVDVLDARLPLDEAFERPRFHLRRPIGRGAPNVVDLEAGHDDALGEQLESRGWSVEGKPRNGGYFGGGNAAQYLPGGRLVAVADTRRTNSAAAE